MIRNYFKIAWRTMKLNRTYSVTNLVGLTIGLVVVMLITSLVLDELSYDHQWAHKDELYRIQSTYYNKQGEILYSTYSATGGLARELGVRYPEVLGYTTTSANNPNLKINISRQYTPQLEVLQSDANFFNLFETQTIEGNPKQVLGNMKNLAISERVHQQHFKGRDVIGMVVQDKPDEGEPETYIINAVLKNLPQNTHLHADAIVIAPQEEAFETGNAGSNQSQYIRVKSGTDLASLTAKINDWLKNQRVDGKTSNIVLDFQSIKDIHLRSETGVGSRLRNVYMLAAVGLLIIILVSVNFVNLTFAHAVKRTQETGIRKVLGANKRHLLIQMGTESFLLFGAALGFAFFGYLLLLPPFEQYFGRPLTLTFNRSIPMFTGLVLCWTLLGLLCGLFPALALSKTKATNSLKKRLTLLRLPLKTGFTSGLVALQFGIAMVVIVCMLIVREQLQYMQNKDLGYNPESLLVIHYTPLERKGETFKQKLLQHTSIDAASITGWTPFSGTKVSRTISGSDNPERAESFDVYLGDLDFARTMGMTLVEGRHLRADIFADAVVDEHTTLSAGTTNALVTETTAKLLQLPLDATSSKIRLTPVGILKDFHAQSLREPIQPSVIGARSEWDQACILIRTVKGREKEAMTAVSDTWNEIFPNRTPSMDWIDDLLRNQYRKETKQFQQLAFFSGISMLIALMGVFGIAIYTIERRVKEIGIRKVMGASVNAIVSMLSASFARLVLIAITIAFPVAWWLMHKWLEDYAYRIAVPPYIFILTGFCTLAFMLAVVGLRAFRAALANPVNSLRDE